MEYIIDKKNNGLFEVCSLALLDSKRPIELNSIFSNNVSGLLICTKEHLDGDVFNTLPKYKTAKPLDIFILSNLKIEEHDNCLDLTDNSLFIAEKDDLSRLNYNRSHGNVKRIIATTNRIIRRNQYSKFRSCCRSEKECNCLLPQLPQVFIAEFINSQGIDYEEVLVRLKELSAYEAGLFSKRKFIPFTNGLENIIDIEPTIPNWDRIYSHYLKSDCKHYNPSMDKMMAWLKLNYQAPIKLN